MLIVLKKKEKEALSFFLEAHERRRSYLVLYISLVSADREFVILPHMPDDLPRPA